jgi:hypothetical protein
MYDKTTNAGQLPLNSNHSSATTGQPHKAAPQDRYQDGHDMTSPQGSGQPQHKSHFRRDHRSQRRKAPQDRLTGLTQGTAITRKPSQNSSYTIVTKGSYCKPASRRRTA